MNEVVAVAILDNKKTGTWHPILFRDSPLPGGSDQRRVKSLGHHTTGFVELSEAEEHVVQFEGAARLRQVIPWDGIEIPAMTGFVVGEELVVFF